MVLVDWVIVDTWVVRLVWDRFWSTHKTKESKSTRRACFRFFGKMNGWMDAMYRWKNMYELVMKGARSRVGRALFWLARGGWAILV